MSCLDSNLQSIYVKIVASKVPTDRNTGKSKRFAFLKAPPHVSDELIKLNGFEFQKQIIRMEDARHQDKCGTIIDLVLISKMLDQILS